MDYMLAEDTSTLERAGFGIRLGAALLDGFFSLIIAGVCYAVFYALGAQYMVDYVDSIASMDFTAMMSAAEAMGPASIVSSLLSLLYYLPEIITGQTLGRKLLHIRIMDESGNPANRNQLFLRFFISNTASVFSILGTIMAVAGSAGLSTILSMVGGIAWLVIFVGCFMVLGSKKQALHDVMARTAVYYTEE